MNRVLYGKAKEMLLHRSGTLYEDMYWIDGDTGNVIAMHTHPQSMPPSISDFNAMCMNGYALGVIICHDGRIFVYTAKQQISESIFHAHAARFKKIGYSEADCQIMAIQKLAENHAIAFREVSP